MTLAFDFLFGENVESLFLKIDFREKGRNRERHTQRERERERD